MHAIQLVLVCRSSCSSCFDSPLLIVETGITLTLVKQLPSGQYNVVLRVADNQGLEQENTVLATVCDCAGPDVVCTGGRVAAVGLPMILGILGAILLLLCKSDRCQYLR